MICGQHSLDRRGVSAAVAVLKAIWIGGRVEGGVSDRRSKGGVSEGGVNARAGGWVGAREERAQSKHVAI